MNHLMFNGTDFMVEPSELSPGLLQDLLDCGGSGDATGPVEYVIDNYDITGDADDVVAMLKPYGAWDDDELTDHHENLKRLVWLTGCSFAEGEPAYFSGY